HDDADRVRSLARQENTETTGFEGMVAQTLGHLGGPAGQKPLGRNARGERPPDARRRSVLRFDRPGITPGLVGGDAAVTFGEVGNPPRQPFGLDLDDSAASGSGANLGHARTSPRSFFESDSVRH